MTARWTYDPHATTAERSLDLSAGVVVKRNRQRTVWRIATLDGEWYLKDCRIDGLRAWFRDLFRGAKAKREFDRARWLAGRGVAVAEPVAWKGRRWPGASAICTRAVPDAVPLDAWLERNANDIPLSLRRTIAVELGRFLRRMADAGVSHPDPHPGNILLSVREGMPVFTWIDVHAVRVGPPLSDDELTAMLVLFNRWFQLRSSASDRLRFLNALGRCDSRVIESRTLESNLVFWQRRLSRYFGNNREYRRIRNGMAMNDVPNDVIQKFTADPDAWFQSATPIKHSKSSTVIRVNIPGVGPCIAKRVPTRGLWAGLKNRLRSSPVCRSWTFGHTIHDRGLPTARPLVMLRTPRAEYLITREIPHAVTLADWVRAMPSRRAGMLVAERLGRLVKTMHDHGVAHRDLKASNILIDANRKPWLIDCVGVTTSLKVTQQTRNRDIARLAASFLDTPAVTNAMRRAFLLSYQVDDWKAIWRELAVLVNAKARRNLKRGRVLA